LTKAIKEDILVGRKGGIDTDLLTLESHRVVIDTPLPLE